MAVVPDRVQYDCNNIDNHIARIRSKGVKEVPQRFINDLDTQDAVILNLQRTIQASFDLAAYIIREELKLPLPKAPKEYFSVLREHGWISEEIEKEVAQVAELRHATVNVPVHAVTIIDTVCQRLYSVARFRVAVLMHYLKAPS